MTQSPRSRGDGAAAQAEVAAASRLFVASSRNVPVRIGTSAAMAIAAASVPAGLVYVVENEITYLAFPPAGDAVVMLGGGYALSGLRSLSWLQDRDLVYWGDIDTHGFAILNRLRQAFPHARSMLMDRATLLDHGTQWVREPKQLNAALPLLDGSEAALYRDLVEDVLGPSVRLEQERVSFAAIERALLPGAPSPARACPPRAVAHEPLPERRHD